MKLPELKELLKQHKIRGSYLNKPEIISRLIENGVLTREDVEKWKPPPKTTSTDVKYERLKRIRTHPRQVEILDRETGAVVLYPSIYKAAKWFNRNSGIIAAFNGKVYKNRYEIMVLESVCETSTNSNDESVCHTCDEESLIL